MSILGVIKLFACMIDIDIKLCKTIIKLSQVEMIQNSGKIDILLIELEKTWLNFV